MRRIRYVLATSLDGYIAGPKDEFDWIVTDPAFDFRALYAQFDTMLVGRRTFETVPFAFKIPDMQVYVFSRTLRQRDHPEVTIVGKGYKKTVAALRAKRSKKDVWLFGGALLFRSLLDAGLVDTLEVAISPVLLGEGIPLLPPPAKRVKLKLTGHRVYKKGMVLLEYAVK
jgi:dihydrofolate reductase